MPDLIPAKDGIFDRHPGTQRQIKTLDTPFDCAKGGEPVEPRIEFGMTKQKFVQSSQLQHNLLSM